MMNNKNKKQQNKIWIGTLDEEKNSEQKLQEIRVEHLHRNMNDLLKEIRFLDKGSLIFSGAIWAWIMQYGENNFILYVIPVLVSCLLFYKTTILLSEYDNQREKYKKIFPDTPEAEESKRYSFNTHFHWTIIGSNIVIAIFLGYMYSGHKIIFVQADANKSSTLKHVK